MGAGNNACCRPSDDPFGTVASDDARQVTDEDSLTPFERFESVNSTVPLLNSEERDLKKKPEHAVPSNAVGKTMDHCEKPGYGYAQTDVSLQAIQQERQTSVASRAGVDTHRRNSWSFAGVDENKDSGSESEGQVVQEHRRRSWTADDVEEQRSDEQAQKALEEHRRMKQDQAVLAAQARADKKLEEQRRTKRKVAEKAMRKLKPPLDISPLLDESPDASLEPLRAILREALGRGLHNILISEGEVRLQKERVLPTDWNIKTYCDGCYLQGGGGGRKASTVIAYELQPASMLAEIQSLFDGTYRKVYTRDRRGTPIPDRFLVKEAHRVMNDQIWREYCARRDKVRACCTSAGPKVPGGVRTMNHITKNKLKQFPILDAGISEVWLFHGTTGAASKGIAENDFRLDLTGSNAGTLYGKGIYLAENSSKSDEYGEGPRGKAGEEMGIGHEALPPVRKEVPPLVRESFMLICRATLGRVHYVDERTPDANKLQESCVNGQFDSVLGDRLKINGTFRETVIYDDDQVYPEYIVKYERIFFHERFAEAYASMLKRKKAGHFHGPNDEELAILKSLWHVYAMPNKGKINKWQLLDLLIAICQPPQDEDADLDATFQEWDTKRDGVIDWEECLQEMVRRVNDGMECSAPNRLAQVYQEMLSRQQNGCFKGATVEEQHILKMLWYQYAPDQRSIGKLQLLELLKALNQPPGNEEDDLDATFHEIDTKHDGVIDFDEFVQEIQQRARDGIPC